MQEWTREKRRSNVYATGELGRMGFLMEVGSVHLQSQLSLSHVKCRKGEIQHDTHIVITQSLHQRNEVPTQLPH